MPPRLRGKTVRNDLAVLRDCDRFIGPAVHHIRPRDRSLSLCMLRPLAVLRNATPKHGQGPVA